MDAEKKDKFVWLVPNTEAVVTLALSLQKGGLTGDEMVDLQLKDVLEECVTNIRGNRKEFEWSNIAEGEDDMGWVF